MKNPCAFDHKVQPEHLGRKAIVYLRQSSDKQVRENLESQRLQRAMADRARALGWSNVEVIDSDLGRSAVPAIYPFLTILILIAACVPVMLSPERAIMSGRPDDKRGTPAQLSSAQLSSARRA